MKKGVTVGTDVLQAAQDAVGLSNERLAREIPVSERTWRRWKESGEVPVYWLAKVAAILNLEIARPPARRVDASDPDAIRQLAEDVAATRDMVERLLRLLATDGEEPSRAASG